MSTMNRFTQHSAYTPAKPHAAQKCVVVNIEMFAPFTQRHGIAIMCYFGVRLHWFALQDRCFYNLLNAPSTPDSPLDPSAGYSNSCGPILEAQSFSLVCHHHIGPLVSVLLSQRSPPTVARFVIAVTVYSVYRVKCAWPLTHILEKRLKRLPAFADCDTTTAVEIPLFIVRVSTAIKHTHPCLIFSGSRHPMLSALTLFASSCSASPKVFASGNFLVSAFANALPENKSVLILADASNYCEFSVDLASNVFEASTTLDRIGISHVSVPLPERNVVRAAPQRELRCRSLLLQNQLAA